MKLTATSPFTFSQACQEWTNSKIVRLYLDTLYASRVDVLEVGGQTNSVLIDGVSKMKSVVALYEPTDRVRYASNGGRQEGS